MTNHDEGATFTAALTLTSLSSARARELYKKHLSTILVLSLLKEPANLAKALEVLDENDKRGKLLAYYAPALERVLPEPLFRAFEGPAMIVQARGARGAVAYAVLPGRRVTVAAIFEDFEPTGYAVLGRARSLDAVEALAGDKRLIGVEPAGKFFDLATKKSAAHLAYEALRKKLPRDLKELWGDRFYDALEMQVLLEAGVEPPLPEHLLVPKTLTLDALAGEIAMYTRYQFQMYGLIQAGLAELYLVSEAGILVPHNSKQPAILATTPAPKPLRKHELPYGIGNEAIMVPYQATRHNGTKIVIGERGRAFGSQKEMARFLKGIGARHIRGVAAKTPAEFFELLTNVAK